MKWVEERKTTNGCIIQISDDNQYQVFNRKGVEIYRSNSPIQKIPRIVFLGAFFKLDHIRLGEINFVSVKSAKVLIPYQTNESNELKFLSYPTLTESDMLPVIVFHKQSSKDIPNIQEKGIDITHAVVEEAHPKPDMINIKIRFPNINVLIIKKKA
jgi:hypothetical protein